MQQQKENIFAEPYVRADNQAMSDIFVVRRDADIGLVPSLHCDGFCTMGIIGGTPKPLDKDKLLPVNARLDTIARERKDCLYA